MNQLLVSSVSTSLILLPRSDDENIATDIILHWLGKVSLKKSKKVMEFSIMEGGGGGLRRVIFHHFFRFFSF